MWINGWQRRLDGKRMGLLLMVRCEAGGRCWCESRRKSAWAPEGSGCRLGRDLAALGFGSTGLDWLAGCSAGRLALLRLA
jgi:hypothetical protein